MKGVQGVAKSTSPLSFLTTITCFMVFLFYFLSNHHNLLITNTYDFIILAKSSNAAIFFVFNLITIVIFIASYNPASKEDFDPLFAFPSVIVVEYKWEDKNKLEEEEEHQSSNMDDDQEEEEEVVDYNGHDDGYEEDNDDDINDQDEDTDEDDCGDIDLESRVEEFIARVNKTWRDELLTERLLHHLN